MVQFLLKSTISILLIGLFLSCGSSRKEIRGGGATFPAPFYQKIFKDYIKKRDVYVNYQAIGSGGGQRQLEEGLLQFGASDVFMEGEMIEKMDQKGGVLHVPMVIGAVVLVHQLSLGDKSLKLSNELIESIMLGRITQWEDVRILELNPEIKDKLKGNITVVHRSDSSGTTDIYSQYLSSISLEWSKKVGKGKSLNWPISNTIGAKGNSGVSQVVISQKGSIGYVSLDYALSSGLEMVLLEDSTGNWVGGNLESVQKGVSNIKNIDFSQENPLISKEGMGVYPMIAFSYILTYKDLKMLPKFSFEDAMELKKLLKWMLSEEAQSQAIEMNYVPIPEVIRQKIIAYIDTIYYEMDK